MHSAFHTDMRPSERNNTALHSYNFFFSCLIKPADSVSHGDWYQPLGNKIKKNLHNLGTSKHFDKVRNMSVNHLKKKLQRTKLLVL